MERGTKGVTESSVQEQESTWKDGVFSKVAVCGQNDERIGRRENNRNYGRRDISVERRFKRWFHGINLEIDLTFERL